MFYKLRIRTSASPRWQLSHWGLRVTQDAYFSLLTHAKQLSLVALCDTTAGIGKNGSVTSVRTNVQTNGRTEGQTQVESEIVI